MPLNTNRPTQPDVSDERAVQSADPADTHKQLRPVQRWIKRVATICILLFWGFLVLGWSVRGPQLGYDGAVGVLLYGIVLSFFNFIVSIVLALKAHSRGWLVFIAINVSPAALLLIAWISYKACKYC